MVAVLRIVIVILILIVCILLLLLSQLFDKYIITVLPSKKLPLRAAIRLYRQNYQALSLRKRSLITSNIVTIVAIILGIQLMALSEVFILLAASAPIIFVWLLTQNDKGV